jgi:hypothetical protein
VKSSPLNLISACGFSFTAYGRHVQIGCKLHVLHEWDEIFEAGKYRNLTSPEDYEACRRAYAFAKDWLLREAEAEAYGEDADRAAGEYVEETGEEG